MAEVADGGTESLPVAAQGQGDNERASTDGTRVAANPDSDDSGSPSGEEEGGAGGEGGAAGGEGGVDGATTNQGSDSPVACNEIADSATSGAPDSDCSARADVPISAVATTTSAQDGAGKTEAQPQLPPCPKWSEVLRSPSEGAAFSPSRDMNRKDNLHGLGLTVAVDRAKTLLHCGKRCSTLLTDVATLYDTYAQSVLKSCESIAPIDGSLQPPSPICVPPILGLASELHRCLVSFAKQMQGLGICVKGSVARPLNGSMSAMLDTVPNISNRYAVTRAKSFNARQGAMRMRARYARSIREAEIAIRDLKRARAAEDAREARAGSSADDARAGDGPSAASLGSTAEEQDDVSISSQPAGIKASASSSNLIDGVVSGKPKGWEVSLRKFGGKHGVTKVSDRVIAALNEVQSLEAQYVARVKEENKAVSRSQTMEIMALEALQKLEEERLQFFIESLGRSLQAERGALDNMSLTFRNESEEESVADNETPLTMEQPLQQQHHFPSTMPKFSNAFAMKKTAQAPFDDRTGTTASTTFGVPHDVGVLRDAMRSHLTLRASRAQAIKAFIAFIEEIASATGSFASSLHARLSYEGYNPKSKTKNSDPLALTLKQTEGTRALDCWNKVIGVLAEHAKALSDLAAALRMSGHTNLDSFLLSAEKDLKNLTENEESRWKQLGETVRNAARLKSQYNKSSSDLQKARDRLAAMDEECDDGRDEGTVGGDSSSSRMHPTMKKALGNMFSILPNDGKEAMAKMMTPDQRRAIAKSSLQEAELKEAKDKKAWESAEAGKEQAISSYSASAKSLEVKFRTDDDNEWGAVRQTFEQFISAVRAFRQVRVGSVSPAAAAIQGCNGPVILQDMTSWTNFMEQKLASHLDQSKREEEGKRKRGGGKLGLARKPQGVVGSSGERVDEGFVLQVHLVESKSVYKLLALVSDGDGDSVPLPDNETDAPFEENNDQLAFTDAPDAPSNVDELSSSEHTLSTPSRKPKIAARSLTSPPDAPGSLTEPPSLLNEAATARQASKTTCELMSLAETLKDSSGRGDDGDNGAGKPLLSPPKPIGKGGEASDSTHTSKSTNAETELFLAHFWEESGAEDSNSPTVIESFSCAYWPKEDEGYISPLLHGRLFATPTAMYFVGWGDKKIVLQWSECVTVTKEATLMGTVENAIRVTYNGDEGASSYFFGSFAFRENAFQLLSRLVAVATSLNKITDVKGKSRARARPDVPPDEVMKKMELVLSKRLKNISMKRFYELVWSEGNRTDSAPFYGPWLEKIGSLEVIVPDWDFSEDGSNTFVNKWDGEKYRQRRVVKFKFTRTTHLYIGPPVAGVIQTQLCRMEGDDKCVLVMVVEMEGIPYSDVFAVEVRWVARRVGLKDIQIDIGCFVDFKKSTMLQRQIKSGTITETKPIHVSLFNAVKEVCAGDSEAAGEVSEEEEELGAEEEVGEEKAELAVTESWIGLLVGRLSEIGQTITQHPYSFYAFVALTVLSFLLFAQKIIPQLQYGLGLKSLNGEEFDNLSRRLDQLGNEVQDVKRTLDEILLLLKDSGKRR